MKQFNELNWKDVFMQIWKESGIVLGYYIGEVDDEGQLVDVVWSEIE